VGVALGVGGAWLVGLPGPELLSQAEIVIATPLRSASAASTVNVRRSTVTAFCLLDMVPPNPYG
jgi:hypothetical protein